MTSEAYKDLEDQFVNRCKSIGVPKTVLFAGWHQVMNQQMTMIVVQKANGEIRMWFKHSNVDLRYWEGCS